MTIAAPCRVESFRPHDGLAAVEHRQQIVGERAGALLVDFSAIALWAPAISPRLHPDAH